MVRMMGERAQGVGARMNCSQGETRGMGSDDPQATVEAPGVPYYSGGRCASLTTPSLSAVSKENFQKEKGRDP